MFYCQKEIFNINNRYYCSVIQNITGRSFAITKDVCEKCNGKLEFIKDFALKHLEGLIRLERWTTLNDVFIRLEPISDKEYMKYIIILCARSGFYDKKEIEEVIKKFDLME